MITPPPRRLVQHGPSATGEARPHGFDPDPDAPGTCRCRLVQAHRLHDPAAVAQADAATAAAQAEQRRRLGEHD